METADDRILRGPPVGPLPRCSLAQYLLPKIRALPKNHVMQVDPDTGASQTVEELLRMSVGLSEGLQKLGLGENDVVGMICRNCFEASGVVLAAWLGGMAVCPTAGSSKPVEMKHIWKLTQPKAIFCEEEALESVMSTVGVLSAEPIVVVMNSTQNNCHSRKTFRDVLVDVDLDSYSPRPVTSPADQLTCILFSSGSSGLPKAVGVTHTNLIFQDMNLERMINPKNQKKCLQVSHFFWVTGILMYLRSLTTGICRVLMRDSNELNLLRAIEQYKTDWTLMGPLVTLSLVESPEFDSYDVSSMKKILVGGSPLTQAMIDKIKAKWSTAQIIPNYGTTEVTGCISMYDEGKDLTSVGKVTPGVSVKIVDINTREAVKAKTEGEICVRSPGIMKGYLMNEAATREVLDEKNWYYTGDLGYYDEDGNIYIVDRLKEMIKIMNMQVAPAEVENAILEVPGVAAAAVTGVTPDGNRCELVALVEKNSNSTVTEKDIAAHVAETLSDYKRLTGGVFIVDGLPKTPNGKLNRREVNRMAQTLYSSARR